VLIVIVKNRQSDYVLQVYVLIVIVKNRQSDYVLQVYVLIVIVKNQQSDYVLQVYVLIVIVILKRVKILKASLNEQRNNPGPSNIQHNSLVACRNVY
jgi:hypothetical protein